MKFKATVVFLLVFGMLQVKSNTKTSAMAEFNYKNAVKFIENGLPDSAKIYLQKALNLYIIVGNSESQVNCLFYLSRIALNYDKNYNILDEYATQLDKILKSSNSNHPQWFESQYLIGVNYIKQNKFDIANTFFTNLEKEIKTHTIADSSLAKFYSKKGGVSYYKGDYYVALSDYNNAVAFGEKAFGHNSMFVSDQVNNLGVINFMLNRFDEALKYYTQADKLIRSAPKLDEIAQADNYINIGLVFKERNDYHEALEFLLRAKDLYLKHEQDNRASITHLYLNIAGVYEDLGQFSLQFQHIIKAREYSEKYFRRLLPRVYFQLAFYYESTKDLNKAYNYLLLAINESKKLFGESVDLAHAYNNMGEFCIHNNYKIKESLPYFQKALALFTSLLGYKNQGVTRSYFCMGEYYAKSGEYEKAQEYYQKSIQSCMDEKIGDDIFSIPSQLNSLSDNYLFETMIAKAKGFSALAVNSNNKSRKIKYLDASLSHYLYAIKLIDKMRSGFIGEESGFILSDNGKFVFDNAIQEAFKCFEETKNAKYSEIAFTIADKVHSANLQLMMKKKGPDSGVKYQWKDSLISKRNTLQQELNTLHGFIAHEKTSKYCDTSKIEIWNHEIGDNVVMLKLLESKIKQNHPAYEHLMHRGIDNNLVSQLGKSLDKDEALLEYYYTDSLLISFCIINNTLFVKKQLINHSFSQAIQDVDKFLQSPRVALNDSLYTLAYRDAAFQLYQMLISPFADKIKDKTLVIIPYNELYSLPFSILLTSSTKNKVLNFKELPYLIKKNPIRYLYAAELSNIKSTKARKSKVLAFAPIYNNTNNNAPAVIAKSRDIMNPLVYNTKEADAIIQLVPGKVYKGKSANEANFKKYAGNYGIIHLAMHTVIDDEVPENSKLVFTPGSSINGDDDLLYTNEAYNMDLNTDLLVMSACKSGYGRLQTGEGMLSLTRGFIFAGVKSIVTSLWTANDRSSAEFFSFFYKNLAQKENKAKAIQEAELQYISQSDNIHSHPYYWAGFILVGQNAPVEFTSDISLCWYVFGGILLIAMVVVRIKTRK